MRRNYFVALAAAALLAACSSAPQTPPPMTSQSTTTMTGTTYMTTGEPYARSSARLPIRHRSFGGRRSKRWEFSATTLPYPR